jgi:hypothetical protein
MGKKTTLKKDNQIQTKLRKNYSSLISKTITVIV